jgi:hypothetical protein
MNAKANTNNRKLWIADSDVCQQYIQQLTVLVALSGIEGVKEVEIPRYDTTPTRVYVYGRRMTARHTTGSGLRREDSWLPASNSRKPSTSIVSSTPTFQSCPLSIMLLHSQHSIFPMDATTNFLALAYLADQCHGA